MSRTFTLVLILFSIRLMSQSVTLSGSVKSTDGTPVVGANVFLKDTYDGASTDGEGNFSFTTDATGAQVLSVSCIGYENFDQPVSLTGEALEVHLRILPAATELDAVVITAGAFEASDERKAVVLRPLDIVMTAGALADIAGAMNTLPGTQIVGEEGKIFVRGGAAHETRTFVDGLNVQNPYSSTVPSIPARGRFSPFLFKGTTFSTGGYSAEYGQALSSALLLETQDVAPKTVTGISLMTVGLGLSHTQNMGKASLSVSGDYSNLAPYTLLVKQNVDWVKPFHGVGGQLGFRYKTSETGLLKVQASANGNGFAMQYPDATNVNQRNELTLNNDNYFANASWKEIIGENWTFFAGAALSQNTDDIQSAFGLHSRETSAQGKMTLKYSGKDMGIKFGGEYWRSSFEERFQEETGTIYETKLNDDYSAVFAESEASISPKLALRAGARLEYSALIQDWSLAPRLSAAFKTGDHSQVSLAYGTFYQKPENNLLRYNTAIRFERAAHYILNYQYMHNRRTFRVEGYYKGYKDLIQFAENQATQSNNGGYGHAWGMDVFYRDQKSIEYGDFWVSYSLLDTKRKYLDFPVGAMPNFASRHNFAVVYKHWIQRLTTSVGLTYSHSSPRAYDDPNQEGFMTGRTSAYNDLSFNASYITNIFSNFTVLYIAVNNLPGFNNTFGQQFSNTPDAEGNYTGIAVRPPAKRFFFVGLFISIGEKFGGI
ncbi:MAG: TonB-dependent receptor [Saprospiraceae bacterium]